MNPTPYKWTCISDNSTTTPLYSLLNGLVIQFQSLPKSNNPLYKEDTEPKSKERPAVNSEYINHNGGML